MHVHRVLFAALKQAVRWRLLSANVTDAVEPPRVTRIEMRTLDGSEVRRLMGEAHGTRLFELILLGVSTGMRRGELLGLRWSDIDFEIGRISVSKALQRDGSLAEPKTARSRRDIALPATAIEALRRYKAQQNEIKLALGPAYSDRGFVFADEFGKSWSADGISTLYRAIVKRAGLGKLRFHDLRHTAASLMLESGLPITTVAAVLGHANTSTTLSVYAHAIKGGEQAGAAVMEGILQGRESRSLNPGERPVPEVRWPNEGQNGAAEYIAGEKAL